MKKLILFLIVCIVITGCTRTETTVTKDSTLPKKTLLIGLIPERNIFKQIERYEPLANYLSEKIGMDIKLKVLTRYGNIIDNFISLGLDGAFFGSFTYTLAHAKLGVEPVARPETLAGSSSYYGMIFVRKDSGINGAQDMKGRAFAFVDKATTAGHLLPLAFFKENGIEDYKKYLKETYFTGTHEDAIYDVLDRKADIGAAKNTVYYQLAESDKRVLQELTILRKSPRVPENGLAFRKDLDNSLKKKIKDVLLKMDKDPIGKNLLRNFGAKRFIETTNSDYAAVYQYVDEIGLDLVTYDYIND